ncbi:hypothetical protein [Sandaracinus amylolyticus]|uniref:Uncharacterized protein n=1 Tax=Sandaracinus amylolyticus TaxID=927083 RepID=A0A0F6W5R3_9BACT|nr:hypothetical protein [Sandaracinus amylolyticus]AKF08193.1 hypothetical protein DB32_005342 [Sandaracinus amylolyticus]
MDDTKKFEDRLAKYDQEWTGPKLHVLLIVTLAIAIAVIYTIASWRSGDFTWDPTAHDPGHEIEPSGW